MKKIIRLSEIRAQAAGHHGGDEAIRSMLPSGIKTAAQLARVPDHRFLAEMTKSIFKAGFVWRVIDDKWPNFEQAFYQFDVETCRFLAPTYIDQLCTDPQIVRNRQKILTVPANAMFIAEMATQHRSFARLVAHWPNSDYIGLLDFLKQHGQRLGGSSCQYFLRSMGKDGFLLTNDVNRALINAGVIDSPATGKKARQLVQAAFNHWQQESGFNLAQISRILALSIG